MSEPMPIRLFFKIIPTIPIIEAIPLIASKIPGILNDLSVFCKSKSSGIIMNCDE